MESKRLIIVGKEVPQSIIDKAKAEYPDHEIVVVDDIQDAKQLMKRLAHPFTSERPTPYTAPPKFEEPDIKDMKFHTPWPQHHKSSKRNRNW